MSSSIERSRLQDCSWDINDEIKNLAKIGIDFRHDHAVQVAVLALRRYVPEMFEWGGERIRVETDECLSISHGEVDGFSDASFGGTLGRVSLQLLHRQENLEGVSLDTDRYDLCLVMTPQIIDPEPVDLVFGQEILVPLSAAQSISR